MELFSYVVARDYGFAPNPFCGVCTLATCKPLIRKAARIGDWVIGTGSVTKGRKGFLVCAMRVTETMTFDEYWNDPRFHRKKPTMTGSPKRAYGDNIYHRDGDVWHQLDSHHSCEDGSPNHHNIDNDTQADRVLISAEYKYWGGEGPEIPKKFRDYKGVDICAVRGHRRNFPPGLVDEFVEWLSTLDGDGFSGEPLEWKKKTRRKSRKAGRRK